MDDGNLDVLLRGVRAAIDELEVWNRVTPFGEAPGFKVGCREALLRSARATTIDELEQSLGMVTRMIVDSGPLSGDFLPSLRAVTQALEKRRRHLASSATRRG
jgi:hypothetical protein